MEIIDKTIFISTRKIKRKKSFFQQFFFFLILFVKTNSLIDNKIQ